MRVVLVFRDHIEQADLDHSPDAQLTISREGEDHQLALSGPPISDIRTGDVDAIYVEVGQDASEWRQRLSAWVRGAGNDPDFR